MTTLSEAVNTYTILARSENRSPRTIEWVSSSTRHFLDFLGRDPGLEEVTPNEVRRFILALQQRPAYADHPYAAPQGRKLTPETVHNYAKGVKTLFAALYREQVITANPLASLKLPRVPEKVIPTLSESEIERFFAQIDRHTRRGTRDYALFILYLDTATRLSELANLKTGDVRIEDSYLMVWGKGGRQRVVPFGPKTAKALIKYKLSRPRQASTDNFFVTHDGRPLTGERIQKICEEYAAKAGLKKCHVHVFRHTSATRFLSNGASAFAVQKLLGHRSLTMTRRYANLSDTDLRQQQATFSVVNRLKI